MKLLMNMKINNELMRKDKLKYLLSILLFSCTAAQTAVKDAAKVTEDCDYLQDYADDASKALNEKDYNLALNIAGEAYMRTLETPDTPCLNDAKDLTKQVTNFIIESAQRKEK